MQILIGGVDKSSLYRQNSLEISDEINARSTCRFQLTDSTGAYHPANGATVEIYDNDANLIFGGFVIEPDEMVPFGTSSLIVNVECVDNQAIADWRLVADSFDSMTTGAIVKDIIDTTLAEEGVWYNPSALSFDGVDDRVDCGNNAVFSLTSTITLEARIKPSATISTFQRCIANENAGSGYAFGVFATNNFEFYGGTAGNVNLKTTSSPLAIDAWQHIAATYDTSLGSNNLKLFLNGVLVTQKTITTPLAVSGLNLSIGSRPNGGILFAGSIDDVRIWNVARTESEILASYNRELIGNESGLVGYWKLNEGTGTTALDSTANANNGTISGATYTTDVQGGQSIQDGATATRAVFPRIPATAAFEELAEMSSFTWWVDSDKRFYFVDRSTYLAPWNITATGPIRNVQYRRNEDQYRNKQYIRAGQDTTDPQVAIFAGDGERRTFTVAYAIAETPVIEVDVGAGYVAKTVGIRGLDTGKDWYWNKNEKEISQDDAGTVLTSAHKLKLPSYVGFFPILTVSESASAIAARKAVSGGTGIREAIEQQASIDSSDAALEIAQGKLVKYARIAGELVFETDLIGLEVGQIITVTFPAHEISAVEFLIDRITISEPFEDQTLRYFVHCVDGQALGNWTTFFKALATQATTFSIRENEVLIVLKSASDTVTVSESLSYVSATPENRVDFALVGFSEVYQLIWNDLDAQSLTWNALDALLFTWEELEAWQP